MNINTKTNHMSEKLNNSESTDRTIHGPGLGISYFLHFFCALGMMAIAIYMTKHFFDVRYNSDLSAGALCDISQFFSCDKASLSPLASIAYVPLSIFGLMVGVFYLIGQFARYPSVQSTNACLTIVNSVGCVLLLIYSLVTWKSLCLMCFLYYLLSFGMLFLYKKWHGLSWRPSVKIIFIYFVMMLLVGGAFAYNVKNKESKKHSIGQDLIQQFDQLPLIGDPNDQYSAKIHMAYETFSKAPIRLSIFSDFQCPACKMFSDLIPAILKRYRSFVNIQYFYYPLDKACNHNIKDDFHGYACQAAYVAECSKNQFLEVHDHIFKEQDKLSEAWIQNYIRQHKLESCVKDMRTRKAVEATILEGDKFSVSSTPTIIFNGVKIGLVPVHHLFLIFDELIAREGKNKKR